MTDETARPRVCSGAAIASSVPDIQALSSVSLLSVPDWPGSRMKAKAVHILASSAVTRRTALPGGHARAATALTAAAASGEPSTPMSKRTGVAGV